MVPRNQNKTPVIMHKIMDKRMTIYEQIWIKNNNKSNLKINIKFLKKKSNNIIIIFEDFLSTIKKLISV